MGANFMQGGQNPSAYMQAMQQIRGGQGQQAQLPNPQMMQYMRALAPGMMAQQMGNAAPGQSQAAGIGNGLSKVLMGAMTGRALRNMQPKPLNPQTMMDTLPQQQQPTDTLNA